MARIAYRVEGPEDRPPIVLLHALGFDSGIWEPQREALAAAHRVIRLDLRGHGGSDAPPGPYNLELLARDVLAVCNDLGLSRFHLCGLSLGGLVALWLAVRYSDRLASACFANTAPRIGSHEGWEERIAAVRQGEMEAIRETALSRFFSDAFLAARPDIVNWAADTLLRTPKEGYIGCCEALRDADLRPDVPKISVPSLIIGGHHDVSTPLEEVRWLHEQIPGSELVLLPAGHISNLECPKEFTHALISFLSQFASPTG